MNTNYSGEKVMNIDNISKVPNISIKQNKEKVIQSISSGREPNFSKIVKVSTYYKKENSHGKKSN